ncbi:MAG TPA: hypothetical protein ENN29_07925, partial [Candidatus Hydrogenedentes bacterium]|nr:hypothetical protein [Candidatus Hydrogenedentota bacterium]
MIRFTFLEQAGLALAVMSDKRDGDCGGATGAQENLKALVARLRPRPRQVLRLRQTHGTRIVTADAQRWDTPEADGVITCQPGLALSVTVADCVPV